MKTQSRELFDEHAGHYNSPIPLYVQEYYIQKRLKFLDALVKTGRVLDTGCGTTTLAQRFPASYQVFATDESLEMLRQGGPMKPRVAQGDLTRLPFKDGSFDLVYNVAVMHHVGEPERIRQSIKEMVRVTKRGGKIVIWDHNPKNPYWKIFMKKLPWDDHVHRLIPYREIQKAFEHAGIAHTTMQYLGLMPDFAKENHVPLWGALEKIFERTPLLRWLCAHHVVVGYKD